MPHLEAASGWQNAVHRLFIYMRYFFLFFLFCFVLGFLTCVYPLITTRQISKRDFIIITAGPLWYMSSLSFCAHRLPVPGSEVWCMIKNCVWLFFGSLFFFDMTPEREEKVTLKKKRWRSCSTCSQLDLFGPDSYLPSPPPPPTHTPPARRWNHLLLLHSLLTTLFLLPE